MPWTASSAAASVRRRAFKQAYPWYADNRPNDTSAAEEVARIMCARVRDVMTPGPIGVDYDQSIGEAARTMRDWGIGAVLVVRDGSLYGLVTDRDLVVRAVAEAKGPDEPVGPLSSSDLIGVDADADIAVAARLMREHAVRRLPVLQDGQVTGIVSLGDLALPDPPAADARRDHRAHLRDRRRLRRPSPWPRRSPPAASRCRSRIRTRSCSPARGSPRRTWPGTTRTWPAAMLPWLKDRPVSMVRYPDGLDGERFFQKNAPSYFPGWIRRVTVGKEGGEVEHVVCDKPATLVYLANQACIEIHAFTSRADQPGVPDQVVFDFDPPDGERFAAVRQAALQARDLLEHDLGLSSFVRTTGGRGLHVHVPLIRRAGFDAVLEFTHRVAACWPAGTRTPSPPSSARTSGAIASTPTSCGTPTRRPWWPATACGPGRARRSPPR